MNVNVTIPFVWHIVSDKMSEVVLSPTIEDTKLTIYQVISEIADSLEKVPRIEKFLFENFSSKPYHNLVKKNEDHFIEIENFFNELINLNSEPAIS